MKTIVILIFIISQIFADDRSNHRVNLEDIERDNILSEKLAKKSKSHDIFEIQQTQNFHTKHLEYYRQQLKALKELQEQQEEENTTPEPESTPASIPTAPGGVTYTTPSSTTFRPYKLDNNLYQQAPRYQYKIQKSNLQNESVKEYVTIVPKPKYFYQRSEARARALGGDESSQTYAAKSHATLSRPIIPTLAPYFQQHRQPNFVYVQSNRIQPKAIQYSPYQQQVVNDVQYASTGSGSSHGNVEESATPATIVYSHDDGIQDAQPSQQPEVVKDQVAVDDEQPAQQPYPEIYQAVANEDVSQQSEGVQYVPYIAQGPNQQQSYITMVAIPTSHGHNAQPIHFTPSVITYSHSGPAAITPVVGSIRPGIQYLPQTIPTQSTGAIQYVNSKDIAEVPPTVQYASQQQDVQYVDPEQTSSRPITPDGSKQFKYAPKNPERPLLQENLSQVEQKQQIPYTNIQYIPSQRVVPLQQQIQYVQQPQSSINVQPLLQFQPYREPKSLLDSYIPSWVVLQHQQQQRQQIQQFLLQQQRARSLQHSQQASAAIPHYNYNTIAFSTQQGPVSYQPSSHIKRSSTVTEEVKKEKKD